MKHIPSSSHFALAIVLVIAASIRFMVAPLSPGPDVAQFWAFAKVFQTHGLDFYRYADVTLDIFPFKGWAFVYPPVWLLSLGLSLAAVPESFASPTVVDASWRLAAKTPIIVADLVVGVLLYWAVRGPRTRKLVFASLWLFHPTAWYESAVFGQFDAIAAAFLLASVLLFGKRMNKPAFLLAGLAFMTKQHTLMALTPVMAITVRRLSWRQFLRGFVMFLAVAMSLSIPFLLSDNLLSYARSVFLPSQEPNYQQPLVYAFSGTGSLLTYIHDVFGWETSGLLKLNLPVLGIALLAAVLLSYIRLDKLTESALAGFLLFVGLSYQVNYQYLVAYIPLAILTASNTTRTYERASALLLALLPSLWLWLFDVSFWFRYFQPSSDQVTPLLSLFGLTRYSPDYVYVCFALVLMSLALTYVFITFAVAPSKRNWQRPPKADCLCEEHLLTAQL